jgi:NADH-quinone oxidoreductase subunit J
MGHNLYRADYPAQEQAQIMVVSGDTQADAAKAVLSARAAAKSGTNTQQLASVMYGDFLVPFEAASVLLLVAALGAVFLVKKEV